MGDSMLSVFYRKIRIVSRATCGVSACWQLYMMRNQHGDANSSNSAQVAVDVVWLGSLHPLGWNSALGNCASTRLSDAAFEDPRTEISTLAWSKPVHTWKLRQEPLALELDIHGGLSCCCGSWCGEALWHKSMVTLAHFFIGG